jgi:hypothetical protein
MFDENEQMSFQLENGIIIFHAINYGDQLYIEDSNVIKSEQLYCE